VVQARVTQRSRSYAILDRFLRQGYAAPGLLSVFAFTEDFFRKLESEDFDAVRVRGAVEQPDFARHYGNAWKKLALHRLDELSRRDWAGLTEKLTRLHGQAYGWKPPQARVEKELAARLGEMAGQQTRSKLKGLVDELDVLNQEELLGTRAALA
jgi:hypothetical protein